MDYRIVGFQEPNVSVEFDGRVEAFALAIAGDQYPTGPDLDAVISGFIANSRRNRTPISAANAREIQALVEASTLPPAPTAPVVLMDVKVRQARNRILFQTDCKMAVDAPFDKTAWGAYREALRNITSQVGFPDAVVWPVPPTAVYAPRGFLVVDVDGIPSL
jgi:hypothetical protein